MTDKDTYWTFENGLPTLVTTLLQMNMNGYPLVLPDMIGGNGYNEPPSKELFIRWLQANVFMPSMQFSYVPWDFDNEVFYQDFRCKCLYPIVGLYDIRGRKREVLFFYFVPGTTRDYGLRTDRLRLDGDGLTT
jgi:hypothetical protein